MKKEKQRTSQAISFVALIVFAATPVKADSSNEENDDFSNSGLKTFVVEELYDKTDVDDFWIELVRIDELAGQLEDLEALDKERFDAAFQGAVEFIRNAGSPEELLEQIESRLDRMLDRIIDEYSPNSGQNDDLDAHMRENYDPFVNTMAEFFARSAQQGRNLNERYGRDPLAPDPRLAQSSTTDNSAESNGMLIIEYLKKRIAEVQKNYESVMKQAIEAMDNYRTDEALKLKAKADRIELEQRRLEAEKKAEEEALEAAIKANNKALEEGSKTDTQKMPLPDSVDPGYPGAGIFVRMTMALEVDLEERMSPIWGLINPGPDGDNHLIDDVPERDPMGEELDPYINPGNENFDEPANVPDAFAPLPHIDNFGGAVDPLGPKGGTGSEKSDSGKKSENNSPNLFAD